MYLSKTFPMPSPSFYVGWTAVVIGSFSSIPQVIQMIRTRSVDDLSPIFVGMRISSEVLYAVYGCLTHDYVMIASTALPLVSDCIQLKLYIKYTHNNVDAIV